MFQKLKNWWGLGKSNPFITNFFENSNIRSSLYMTSVVLLLETWMIYSLTNYVISSDKPRDTGWYISHYGRDVILWVAAFVLLVYAIQYIRGKREGGFISQALLWTFSLICLAFGIYVGYNDFQNGEQILAFLTMTVFVLCLFVWNPVIVLVLSAGSFGILYRLVHTTIGTSQATDINLFTMWLTVFMVGIANYHQRRNEAQQAEGLVKVNGDLLKRALMDDLTGIPNMRCFYEEAAKRWKEAYENKQEMIYLYFDVENFKAYNDKYGFRLGDERLKEIAVIFTKSFPDGVCARFSDDHFAVLTPKISFQETIQQAELEIHKLEGEVQLNLKTGSYSPKEEGESPNRCCDRARMACDSIKKMYDKAYREYDDEMEDLFQQKQYIVNHIDMACRGDYIRAFYQPIINCKNGHLCGLEALARWDDPRRGLLPPITFIPTLEEYRQIHKLDQRVIELVCRDYAECVGTPLASIPVSINFSRLDFELYDVPKVLTKYADEYHVPYDKLDVEITESALTGDVQALKENMKILRGLGYSQWLDDFGSGYSSLNTLKDFEFDVMKIDMVFLKGFPDNPKSRPILMNVVELAKKLGMVTLTEGVETKDQYEFLQSIGCDKAQGFYFGKPMPREELLQKIEKGEFII